MKSGLPFSLVFVLAVSGCTLDLTSTPTVNPDDVPLLVMQDFEQSTVRDGRVLYSVQGARAENYSSHQEIRLKDFTFQEYDGEGKVVSQGSSQAAIIHTDTNNAHLDGTLRASSTKQSVALTIIGGPGGSVEWKNQEKVMTTLDGSSVVLKKDDGSRITAQGMVLNLKSNDLALDKAITGVWQTNEEAP